jgi:hypothetical protein
LNRLLLEYKSTTWLIVPYIITINSEIEEELDSRGMQKLWGKLKVHRGTWLANLTGRGHLEDMRRREDNIKTDYREIIWGHRLDFYDSR